MLTPESLKKIDRELAKSPAEQFQSAIMAGPQIAQEEGLAGAGNHRRGGPLLGIEPIAAYEVASFYNMYDLKPVGSTS